ncbi:uncharacterized protein LOC141909010 [Tubulanus polymorphus]|uniref:uncharacterized protein LOC141909010 n=1 Tax=Tubulanus polymorphus TaxID=672921 RepID=UPI003DA62B58
MLIECPPGAVGRYVVLMKQNAIGSPLTVCEVQVYGTLKQLMPTTTLSTTTRLKKIVPTTTLSATASESTFTVITTLAATDAPVDAFPVIAVAVGSAMGALVLLIGLIFLILRLLKKPPFQQTKVHEFTTEDNSEDWSDSESDFGSATPRSITSITAVHPNIVSG